MKNPLLLVLGHCLLTALLLSRASAREVEATREWTILGENDTVAAGMHVRIDMTTGEKWVKLPDEEETNQQQHVAVVSGTGETTTYSNIGSTDQEPPEYDFDMMYRTLSKLPEEEKRRMDLPDLPTNSVHALSPEAREQFETRLNQIWKERQQSLIDAEVADLPQVLKDCIERLRSYLEDPISHWEATAEDANKSILETLQELEYHLQDVDMTRDFHTLGGWTVLAELLQVIPNSNSTAIHEAADQVHLHTAWALGTAVKNTKEFAPYVLEYVQSQTVLDVVLQHFQRSPDGPKRVKFLYCLGSFLRGNPEAQKQFHRAAGPTVLWEALSTKDPKMRLRLVNLVADMVSETPSLEDSYSSRIWCERLEQGVVETLQSASLPVIHALVSPCRHIWRKNGLAARIQAVMEDLDPSFDQEKIFQATETLRILNETEG